MFTMSPPSARIASTAAREPHRTPRKLASTSSADLVVGVLPGLRGAQDAGVVDPHLQRPALGGGRGDLAVAVRVADVLCHVPGVLAEQLGGLAGGVLVHVRDEHGVAACASAGARSRGRCRAPRR